MTAPFTPQDGLVAAMVLTAAADGRLSNAERGVISGVVGVLPIFRGFAETRFAEIGDIVMAMLEEEDGVDQVMLLLEQNVPQHLRETAYALACDVTAADALAAPEELAVLEIMRDRLGLDPLAAAAIERAARARFRLV